jgi:hypothetical protein
MISKTMRFNLYESEMFVNFVKLKNTPMKNLLFKSNPNELSTFAILFQMALFGVIGLGSIIAIFYLMSNVF